MVSIDIHPMDNAMLYGKISRGFKSGGFNGRANNPGEDQPYDPETMTSYEVGAKHSWLNERLILNASWFWNFYKDFQARVSRSVTSPSQPIPAIDFAVLNAGSLHIDGGELEFAWQATPTFKLDSQIGYLQADYKQFSEVRTGFGAIDHSWQTPAFSPKWTARFGASKEFGMFGGTMRFAGSARYRSRMALSVDNSNVLPVADSGVPSRGIFPGMWQNGYWLYDANAVWTSPNGGLSLGIYGRNLSDTLYRTDAQEFSSVGKIRTAYYGAPETVSFAISGRF
jgi:iron complex outermembrane receptor protein